MSIAVSPAIEGIRVPQPTRSRVLWWSGIAPGSLSGHRTEEPADVRPTAAPTPAPAGAPGGASCAHDLGGLPCVNAQPHPGRGRGCVHHSASGFPNDE